MTLSLVTLAAVIASYDCELDVPRAVWINGASTTASEIGLPPMSLGFSVAFESGNPALAKVNWAGDPMQIEGQFPAVQSAPGAYAFSAYSPGPCLFTEQACIAQVNLVDRGGGNAQVIVTPVALALDEGSGVRVPFVVVTKGQCTRTDSTR